MALIYSELPCRVAGLFTINRAKAAPVLLDEKKIKKGYAQAVIINSGNANACTGTQGLKNGEQMIKKAASVLGISPDLVFVSSTGKIGIQLPMEKILKGVSQAASELSEVGLPKAAQAILTTDFFSKIQGVKGKIGNKEYSIVGFAKGAGMIEPQMRGATFAGKARKRSSSHATMLGFFMTDLNIESKILQKIFSRVVDRTFNRITVDGDMSTNDTALLLANGLAGNSLIRKWDNRAKEFEKNLEEVAHALALQMVEDGEGATKVVEIEIKGVRSEKEGRQIAYAVGRSQLVKTSFFGQDPNWGRLLAAAGYSGATFDPSKVDIYYGPVKIVSEGMATTPQADAQAHEVMKAKFFKISFDFQQGKKSFRIWTSDLNFDYVKLNAEYRT